MKDKPANKTRVGISFISTYSIMKIKHNSKFQHLGDLAFSFCCIIPCLFSQRHSTGIFWFCF